MWYWVLNWTFLCHTNAFHVITDYVVVFINPKSPVTVEWSYFITLIASYSHSNFSYSKVGYFPPQNSLPEPLPFGNCSLLLGLTDLPTAGACDSGLPIRVHLMSWAQREWGETWSQQGKCSFSELIWQLLRPRRVGLQQLATIAYYLAGSLLDKKGNWAMEIERALMTLICPSRQPSLKPVKTPGLLRKCTNKLSF